MTSDELRAVSRPGADPTNGATDPMINDSANGLTNGVTDPDRLDLLDRYWDATTGNSFQPAQSIALDPAHARMVDLIQTLANNQTAGIPADARARIWRVTAERASIPTRQESPVTTFTIPGSGAATPGLTLPASNPPQGRRSTPPSGPVSPGGRWSVPGCSGPSQPTGPTWWPRLQFAVAATLILGLFATILAPMDDGRVGLFGGISGDATPTAQTSGGSVDVFLPATNRAHTITFDRLTIAAGQRLVIEPGPFSIATVESGSISIAEFGSGLAYTDVGGMIPINLYGGHITAVNDNSAVIQLVTISAMGDPEPSIQEGIVRERLGSFDTSTFVGQDRAEGWMMIAEAPRQAETIVPLWVEGTHPFRAPSTEAFVYADQGTTRIISPDQQARLVPSGTGSPTDFAIELPLPAGDAAIIGNASLATIQSGESAELAIYSTLVLAPNEEPTTGLPTTPFVDADLGRAGSVSLPNPSETTITGVALELVTIQDGATWVIPGDTAILVLWIGGSAEVSTDDGVTRPETDPLRYPEVVTLEPGTALLALGPAPASFQQVALYEGLAPGSRLIADGVQIDQLAQEGVPNAANANGIDLTIRMDFASPELENPFYRPDETQQEGQTGLIYANQGTLTVNALYQSFQTAMSGISNMADLAAGQSGTTFDTTNITVASPELPPATSFTSVLITPRFETAAPVDGSAVTPAAEIPSIQFETTVDAATQDFNFSLEQHVMGPGSDFMFFLDDTPGGTVVTYISEGSATLTIAGQEPVEVSAATPDQAVAELAGTDDLTIVPGSDGATLYHALIGFPQAPGNSPGSQGNGDLAVNYLGFYGDRPYEASSLIPGGGTEPIRISLSVDGLDVNSESFDSDATATMLTPIQGTLRVIPETGELLVNRNIQTISPETSQTEPTTFTPGQGLSAQPGSTFSIEAGERSTSYLTLEVGPATPPDATPVAGAPVPALVYGETLASQPVDAALGVELHQVTIQPGDTVTYDASATQNGGTVLALADFGAATLSTAGQEPIALTAGGDAPTGSVVLTSGSVELTTDQIGTRVYLLILGEGIEAAGTGTAQIIPLAMNPEAAPLSSFVASDDGLADIHLSLSILSSFGQSMGDGYMGNSPLIFVSPLSEGGQLTPGTGDVYIMGGDPSGNLIAPSVTGPLVQATALPIGSTVVGSPGSTFQVDLSVERSSGPVVVAEVTVLSSSSNAPPATVNPVAIFSTPGTDIPEPEGVNYIGYDVDLPANDEFLAGLDRYTMEPGATLTRFFSDISLTTVASFVAEGSVALIFQGAAPLELVGGSDAAFGSMTGTGILSVAPGPDGAVLYQAAPGSNISESFKSGVSVRGGVTIQNLGSFVDALSLEESVLFGTGSGSASVSFGLDRIQDGRSQPFGNPTSVTMVTPIDGPLSIVPGTGQLLRSKNTVNVPPTDPEIVERETIDVGSGVTIQPGGQFRVE